MKLRIGILSTSSIAPRFIRAVQATDGCEASALASRSLEKAQEKAELWNVPKAYGSYEELICSNDIDAVYVAMINSEHYRYVRMALEQGKHVLCEKPCTLYEAQVRELFALAREKKRFLMEMQKAVFLPVIQKVKEVIQAGEFGAIRIADFSSSFDPGYNTWLFDPEKGGGTLFSSAVYCIELMQYLFDCPVTDWTGLCTRSHTTVENQFSTSFLMENGLLFTNKNSTCVETDHTAFLYGEKGYIEIPEYWKARKAVLHYKNQDPVVLEYPCDYELIYEVLHAESCIRAGLTESPVMTEEMTASAIRTLEGIHKLWNPTEKAGA